HERGKVTADAAIGLDGSLWDRVRKFAKLDPRETKRAQGDAERLAPELRAWARAHIEAIPLDYGVFALMVDQERLAGRAPPTRLADLLQLRFKRSLILEDPRTSTPGLAFVLLTYAVLGEEKFVEYWKQLRSTWLTLAPGWDGAYSLFMKGEAPLVWSYTSSQAYHEEHGDKPEARRYRAIVFKDGNPLQIEYAILLAASQNPQVERLGRFLIRADIQTEIARRSYMLPARADAGIGNAMVRLPKALHVVPLLEHQKRIQEVLKIWERVVETGK
ncbi:MAG: thiamine ABC transporter substrate-binding protein, partial [Bdellovibrionota bacterium]